MIQEDNEPALLLSSFETKEETGEVFLNEEKVSPKLRSNGDIVSDSNMWYIDIGASNHMVVEIKQVPRVRYNHPRLDEIW